MFFAKHEIILIFFKIILLISWFLKFRHKCHSNQLSIDLTHISPLTPSWSISRRIDWEKNFYKRDHLSFFLFFVVFVGKLIHVEQSLRRWGRQRARPTLVVVIMLFLVNKTIVNINQIGLTGLAHYWLLDCRLWWWCCLWWLNWIQRLSLSPL